MSRGGPRGALNVPTRCPGRKRRQTFGQTETERPTATVVAVSRHVGLARPRGRLPRNLPARGRPPRGLSARGSPLRGTYPTITRDDEQGGREGVGRDKIWVMGKGALDALERRVALDEITRVVDPHVLFEHLDVSAWFTVQPTVRSLRPHDPLALKGRSHRRRDHCHRRDHCRAPCIATVMGGGGRRRTFILFGPSIHQLLVAILSWDLSSSVPPS